MCRQSRSSKKIRVHDVCTITRRSEPHSHIQGRPQSALLPTGCHPSSLLCLALLPCAHLRGHLANDSLRQFVSVKATSAKLSADILPNFRQTAYDEFDIWPLSV